MKLEDIEIGKIYTYYPKAQNIGDNFHYPVLVEEITKSKRVRCRVPKVKRAMVVLASRLTEQMDLF